MRRLSFPLSLLGDSCYSQQKENKLKKIFREAQLKSVVGLLLLVIFSSLSPTKISANGDVSSECLIVFADQPREANPPQITIFDPVTGTQTLSNLVLPTDKVFKVATSPSGRFIVYTQDNGSFNRVTYVEDTVTSNHQTLLGDTTPSIIWSPDEKHMAYVTQVAKANIGPLGDFYAAISDADGTNLRSLKITEVGWASAAIFDWSPSDNYIVVSGENAGAVIRVSDLSMTLIPMAYPIVRGYWVTDRYFIYGQTNTSATIYRTTNGTSFQISNVIGLDQLDISPNGDYAIANHEMYRLEDGTKLPYGNYDGVWDTTNIYLAVVPQTDNTSYDLKAYHPLTNSYDAPLALSIAQSLATSGDRKNLIYGRSTGSQTQTFYLFNIQNRRETRIADTTSSTPYQNGPFVAWWYYDNHILAFFPKGIDQTVSIVNVDTGKVQSQVDHVIGFQRPINSNPTDLWLYWKDTSDNAWVGLYAADGLLTAKYLIGSGNLENDDVPALYLPVDSTSIFLVIRDLKTSLYNLVQAYSDGHPPLHLRKDGSDRLLTWSSNKNWFAFGFFDQTSRHYGVAVYSQDGKLIKEIQPVMGTESQGFWSSCKPPFDQQISLK